MPVSQPERGLNPIAFIERVNREFLDYQFTAFPITDPELAAQAKATLRQPGGKSPLFQGPYVSLSRAFRQGANLRDLAREGVVHPALPGLTNHPQLFAHQEAALRAILDDRHALIATGTGSGKTEAFLYPILDHCLRLRDAGAPDGVTALLVYPMNALALDQLRRLRGMLAGSGITFGMYVGSVAQSDEDATLVRALPAGATRADYIAAVNAAVREERIVAPPEERYSEAAIRAHPPRILLTNVNQLELLLTRGSDLGLFTRAPLRFLVFDEAHTYAGATGAEVACLIRRLRAFCGKRADEVLCIGTSATFDADEHDQETMPQVFAQRFFGVDPERVRVIREVYEEDPTPAAGQAIHQPARPSADQLQLLDLILETVNAESIEERYLRTHVLALTGSDWEHGPRVPAREWKQHLYDHLCANAYVAALFQQLRQPRDLSEAVQSINSQLGRGLVAPGDQQAAAELLSYLVLGALAERDGAPLLRPQVHVFVSGLEGAVLTFASDGSPRFFRNEMAAQEADDAQAASFSLLVCRNCGQHYLEHRVRDLRFDDHDGVIGGQLEEDQTIWLPALEKEPGTSRLLFTNRLLVDDEEEDIRGVHKLYLCRSCGALHARAGNCVNPKCRRPGPLVAILVPLAQKDEKLRHCVACRQSSRQNGETVFEPIRPLRASTAADNHILAQNMLNAVPSDRQKLIVFTDNRQDAAFQAGWMQDHARRYRLRHLIYELLTRYGAMPTGDLVEHLHTNLSADIDLARALAPEVFEGRVAEYSSHVVPDELKYYLRIQLIREWVTGFKQRDSLETWGKIRVEYQHIEPTNPWISAWAQRLGMDAMELTEGIATILDSYRRQRLYHDPIAPIFGKIWHGSDMEIQRGYLPLFEFFPRGVKEAKEPADSSTYVMTFRSERGRTFAAQFVKKWGKPEPITAEFLTELWRFLAEDIQILKVVTLYSKGTETRRRPLQGTSGVRQIDGSMTRIALQHLRFRCGVCQRIHARPTPGMVCSAHNCHGTLIREEPAADDYNIVRLDQPFTMVMAQEHSAQVPAEKREEIEREFKRSGSHYNCLVATPTLEMGVDIGALDMVLLRNAPPQSSNYWQRVGRAGRRFRMSVAYTYCRASEHDRYFFRDPLLMLRGRIAPPRFNLSNEIMIRKHVHAAIISEMIRQEQLSGPDAPRIRELRMAVLPRSISDYLIDADHHYRVTPFQVGALQDFIQAQRPALLQVIARVFAEYWPERDVAICTPERLADYVDAMPERLQVVVRRIFDRFAWAQATRAKLVQRQLTQRLEPDEERILQRCSTFINQMLGTNLATYTLAVLAREGLLPGYGTYEPGIIAYVSRGIRIQNEQRDFELMRAPSMAVREYVPGNLIYANGGRFKTTLYHLPIEETGSLLEQYHVEPQRQRISQAGGGSVLGYADAGAQASVTGVRISDVDLGYISRISDDETNRFQLPVAVFGMLRREHHGGMGYTVADQAIQHRKGQHIRLVNTGPVDRVAQKNFGYPICTVCGATRSPYASENELNKFAEHHRAICGRDPLSLALSVDATVDGLLFLDLPDPQTAINLCEGLRLGARTLLEMEWSDLDLLVLPREGAKVDVLFYDPMPGGSGLLDQLLSRWQEIVTVGIAGTAQCPGGCAASCYLCLRNYRNTWNHPLLDRHQSADLLAHLDQPLIMGHAIPAAQAEQRVDAADQNPWEAQLGAILRQAGFADFIPQHPIALTGSFRQTIPDYYHEGKTPAQCIAIYLDGPDHEVPEQRHKDLAMRHQLREMGLQVVEIEIAELDDAIGLQYHLHRIGRWLREG